MNRVTNSQEKPQKRVRKAAALSLGLAMAAGLFAYAANGGDAIRAGVAALIWLAMGWYGGKVIFADESEREAFETLER